MTDPNQSRHPASLNLRCFAAVCDLRDSLAAGALAQARPADALAFLLMVENARLFLASGEPDVRAPAPPAAA